MRTALVTGASSDIGIAVCWRYLDAGWSVIGHYRTWRPEMDALTGDASLNTRPMARVITPLALMGASIESAEEGRPPDLPAPLPRHP